MILPAVLAVSGLRPQFPGSEVTGSVVGPEGELGEVVEGVVEVLVVVSPPVYSPGQYPLHSPHCSTLRSPALLTAQLDLPL